MAAVIYENYLIVPTCIRKNYARENNYLISITDLEKKESTDSQTQNFEEVQKIY
jgi:hypothetical protein